jgi:hypothetical protein
MKKIYELRVFQLRTYPAILRGSLADVQMVHDILKRYANSQFNGVTHVRTPNIGIFYRGEEYKPSQEKK